MQVVWFKQDLRTEDHTALAEAAKNGPVLPLYVIEPELWQQPDLSYRRYRFLEECLNELRKELKGLGLSLVLKVGDIADVLEKIHGRHAIQGLWSHQETWNGWTYKRDKKVKRWAKAHHIPWHEPMQHGVIRCLQDRDGWSARWYAQMKKPETGLPKNLRGVDMASDTFPAAEEFGLSEDGCRLRQKGGRTEGLKLLYSFLHERGEGYTKEMSSPVTGFDSCSRLSPHLAFGTLSIREVFLITENRNQEIKNRPPGTKGKWPSALKSFSGRLRWHCHFIQKLEDEPRIEFENMHPAYDGLRENHLNEEYLTAWKQGKTGYPMVDACMRALIATGWLNFRMRAMLMSFASYHLWLHWRETSLHLARLFTDYEPGIHYSQVQMQSGTTGINSIRIYNPIKQGIDQDPTGVFIHEWVPELAEMPQEHIHTPWENPKKMNGYPMPIVDEKAARKAAADQLYGLRKNADHKAISKKIVEKHGSRKSGLPKTADRKKTKDHTKNLKNTLMKDSVAIYWFRRDLRLSDNPALTAASQNGVVLPVYILDEENSGKYAMGGASKWWLHHSLQSLNTSLNGALSIYRGNPIDILADIIARHGVRAVYWNRCYEPWRIARDTNIKEQLKTTGVEVESHNGSLLWEPWTIKKENGDPYKVFTPFYRKGCLQAEAPREPLPAPEKVQYRRDEENALDLEALNLLPKIGWDKQLEPHWKIGEQGAQARFQQFMWEGLAHYKEGRNLPAKPYVSRLSPYLHFGEISPHQLWYGIRGEKDDKHVDHFCSELGWREFSYSQLYQNPDLPVKNLQSKFDHFPWANEETSLQAWQKGQTGIPMVDAGMRELWQTGYMHNRVRMIVGSFLVKNLRLHWHHGERWFWDTLVDADLANNSASWQWIAGCGADAAPYFRIFNPVTQGQKFDPEGNYVRRFIPEIGALPNKYLFNPWEAPAEELKKAGIELGTTYPKPIADLKLSRAAALEAFQSLKKETA